jgi:hypothetical protein
MRIAIFHQFMDNIGGAEIVCLTLAKMLDAEIFTTNIDYDNGASLMNAVANRHYYLVEYLLERGLELPEVKKTRGEEIVDILPADEMKYELRLGLWYIKRKLKKEYGITMEQIKDDLENSGNPVISILWGEVKNTADKVKEVYQKQMILEFPMVALWIMYKDTAYTNPFMYIMKNLMDKKDKLMPFLEKYYREPKDWHVNVGGM